MVGVESSLEAESSFYYEHTILPEYSTLSTVCDFKPTTRHTFRGVARGGGHG